VVTAKSRTDGDIVGNRTNEQWSRCCQREFIRLRCQGIMEDTAPRVHVSLLEMYEDVQLSGVIC